MAAGPSIDVTGWLQEQLAQGSPDLLRSMVQTFAEALMGAEADAVCGAGILPGPDRPRPVRRRSGHLRCAPRPDRGDRRDPARCIVAAVPHPLKS